jgi:hypothetical protein
LDTVAQEDLEGSAGDLEWEVPNHLKGTNSGPKSRSLKTVS